MVTPEIRLRKYCINFKDIEGYEEAVQSPEQYHLHHRKEIETLDDGTMVIRSRKELIELGLYYNRPAEELIFLKHSDHQSIHKPSANTRSKMSSWQIGEKHHNWKGDLAYDHAKYLRQYRQNRRELLSNQ